MSQILSTRLPIDVAEVRAFLFDFSQCDEAKAGLTLASATVSPSTGVAIGTPAIITTETNGIMAGLGVQVTLSVAAAAVYDVKCIGIFVGGSTVVVKGELVGES